MKDTKARGKDWQTIITLALSAFGILYLLIQSLALGIFWLTELVNDQVDITQKISTGLFVWSSLLGGLVLLPVLLLSICRLRDQPIPAWLNTRRPVIGKAVMWLILVWPVMVFLGWLVAGAPKVAVFLLGPINLLVAGIPVLWVYNATQRKLNTGSQMRKWRIFGFSFAVTPIVILGVEIFALLVLSAAAWLWVAYRISVDPSFERELMYIVNQITLAGNDLDMILQLLEPYLLTPAVIVWALVIIGGIVPVIEEVVKPLALWSLAGRKITPQEGFVGGLLCGAGFALLENLLYGTTALAAEDWLFMAVGRAGTGVLHMLASGLVGWGLAKLWQDGKWLFSGLMLLGAILLHGVWNAVALVSGVAPLYMYGPEVTISQTLLFYLPVIFLLILSAIGLFLMNWHFLRKQSAATPETNEDGLEK
jgi:hypothetical protein